MHRQLEAAMANGAIPDPDALAAVRSLDAKPQVELETTLIHEIVHGESWLALVLQVFDS